MFVNKTHSKKDLVELFDKLGVGIDKKSPKSEILLNINSYIKECKYNNKIKNETELKDYLKDETTKQRPDIDTKNNIMFKCKKIIKWANENYDFNDYSYKYEDEPLNDIMFIYKWGDIPSVRRACRFYNNWEQRRNHINPIISEEVQERLTDIQNIKSKVIKSMVIRKCLPNESIILTFN